MTNPNETGIHTLSVAYTQGEWESVIHEGVDGIDYIQILAGSWDIVHNKYSARDWEEEKANAQLIKTAPKLLQALFGCVKAMEQQNIAPATTENAKAVIAEATQIQSGRKGVIDNASNQSD